MPERLCWASTLLRVLWISLTWLSCVARADGPEDEFLRGHDLFTGRTDLHGRIYTHRVDLPPAAVVCANCHAADDGPDVPRSRAPRLNDDLLLRPQPRRGGPTSAYDRDGFCALLRRGIDPAFVLISVEMPRYTLQDAECQALWRYLTGSGHAGNGF